MAVCIGKTKALSPTLNGDSQPLPLKYDLVPCGVLSPDAEPLLRPLLLLSSCPPLLKASRPKRLSEEGWRRERWPPWPF